MDMKVRSGNFAGFLWGRFGVLSVSLMTFSSRSIWERKGKAFINQKNQNTLLFYRRGVVQSLHFPNLEIVFSSVLPQITPNTCLCAFVNRGEYLFTYTNLIVPLELLPSCKFLYKL